MPQFTGFTTFSDLVRGPRIGADSPPVPHPPARSFPSGVKTGLAIISGLILSVLAAGCAGDQPASSARGRDSSGVRPGEIAVGADGVTGLDLGEDWDASVEAAEARGDRLALPSATGAAPSALDNPSGATGDAGFWAIVLFTYTDASHPRTAAQAAARLRALGPQYAGVRSHTESKGSMVLFNVYPSRDDPAARADLARLRSAVTPDGTRRVFPQVMLAFIEPENVTYSRLDLRSVRQQFGAGQTLYTLDVAVWTRFEDEGRSYDELKREAEAYCRQLRAAGFEAYYYHNERAVTSNVTVGVFGPGAVNAQTGIYSEDVMRLVKQLPNRLTNGEPLEIPIDRFHPSRGTRPQSPVLVEVPE